MFWTDFQEQNGFQEDKSKDVMPVMFLNMEAFEWLSLQPVFRTNLNSMIKVSETAKTKVISLLSEEGKSLDSSYLRVTVESGGCSGLSYKMDLVQSPEEGDKQFEDRDVRILVDKKSMLYLVGTTLEYAGGLNGKGFSFNNPNASRTCGCGESFAV